MKTNEDYLNEFLDDAKLRGWSEWPVKCSNYTIPIFFDQIDKSCIDVDMNDLRKFLMYLQKRPGRYGKKKVSYWTIKKHVDLLASFYEFLDFEGYIDKSLIPQFRKRYVRPLKAGHKEEIKRQNYQWRRCLSAL